MAREGRTRPADRRLAEARLDQARAFLEQARLSAELLEGPGRTNAVVSSAVLAGIAAGDAATGFALGEISSGAHELSARLLGLVADSGKAVSDLRRLLRLKTTAQYAGGTIQDREIVDVLTRAQRLIDFAAAQRRT